MGSDLRERIASALVTLVVVVCTDRASSSRSSMTSLDRTADHCVWATNDAVASFFFLVGHSRDR